MASIGGRLKHAWNAFTNQTDAYANREWTYGQSSSRPPDRLRFRASNDRSFVASLYMRIALDVSAISMKHVRMDENEQYVETIQSGLNNCLTLEANVDQAARAFMQDLILTMFDEGVIAVVPIDTTLNPQTTGGYDIKTMRVGRIVQFYEKHVRVSVWREETQQREEITLLKTAVSVIMNPLYMVMNEPNSTLQRLIRKLHLLDAVDEASNSGKLDLIIQLPYAIKSETKRQQAEQRRKDIEMQLKGAQYGIAYADGTEKITQLNRPAENNLLAQIEYLTEMVYAQLGLTKGVFDGTADEKTMVNYYNRTVEPLLAAVAEGLTRTFITKTARTQLQTVAYFRDPFKLVAISDLAEIADKFTRNEILSSNEFRGIIGYRPSKDPDADKLRNKNIPEPDAPAPAGGAPSGDSDAAMEQVFSSLEASIDKIVGGGDAEDAA